MRVELNTVEDFIAELKADGAHRSIVRVRIDRQPENSDGNSFVLGVWMTAITLNKETLIELGLPLGPERHGAKDAADKMVGQLADACENLGLELRGGKFEVY